jgi:DNA-binding transcriptional regulator YiaG
MIGPLQMRLDLGLTQSQLSELLDVNVQTVARYEKGLSSFTGPYRTLLLTLHKEHQQGRADALIEFLRSVGFKKS